MIVPSGTFCEQKKTRLTSLETLLQMALDRHIVRGNSWCKTFCSSLFGVHVSFQIAEKDISTICSSSISLCYISLLKYNLIGQLTMEALLAACLSSEAELIQEHGFQCSFMVFHGFWLVFMVFLFDFHMSFQIATKYIFTIYRSASSWFVVRTWDSSWVILGVPTLVYDSAPGKDFVKDK